MDDDRSTGRVKRLLLFIMLVMGTLLHASSVAPLYLPGIRKMLSLVGIDLP